MRRLDRTRTRPCVGTLRVDSKRKCGHTFAVLMNMRGEARAYRMMVTKVHETFICYCRMCVKGKLNRFGYAQEADCMICYQGSA